MEGMSLQQGKLCNAVSVSVVLRSDGRLVINEIVLRILLSGYPSSSGVQEFGAFNVGS